VENYIAFLFYLLYNLYMENTSQYNQTQIINPNQKGSLSFKNKYILIPFVLLVTLVIIASAMFYFKLKNTAPKISQEKSLSEIVDKELNPSQYIEKHFNYSFINSAAKENLLLKTLSCNSVNSSPIKIEEDIWSAPCRSAVNNEGIYLLAGSKEIKDFTKFKFQVTLGSSLRIAAKDENKKAAKDENKKAAKLNCTKDVNFKDAVNIHATVVDCSIETSPVINFSVYYFNNKKGLNNFIAISDYKKSNPDLVKSEIRKISTQVKVLKQDIGASTTKQTFLNITKANAQESSGGDDGDGDYGDGDGDYGDGDGDGNGDYGDYGDYGGEDDIVNTEDELIGCAAARLSCRNVVPDPIEPSLTYCQMTGQTCNGNYIYNHSLYCGYGVNGQYCDNGCNNNGGTVTNFGPYCEGAPTGPNCGAQTVYWAPGCSAYVGPSYTGNVINVTNSAAGYTGNNSVSCNGSSLQVDGATFSGIQPSCKVISPPPQVQINFN
jgi:hypothetical protein